MPIGFALSQWRVSTGTTEDKSFRVSPLTFNRPPLGAWYRVAVHNYSAKKLTHATASRRPDKAHAGTGLHLVRIVASSTSKGSSTPPAGQRLARAHARTHATGHWQQHQHTDNA